MLLPSLLIVSDRGGLRAYKVEPNPDRGPGLHLLDSFESQDGHGHLKDKVTDRAGRFQGAQTAGRHIGGADEHGTIDIENDRRACKQVAGRINELVKREKPESWLLAVPAQIQQMMFEHLDSGVVKHLGQTVKADLVKVEPAKLANHFSVLHHP